MPSFYCKISSGTSENLLARLLDYSNHAPTLGGGGGAKDVKMWRRLYGDVFEGSMAGRKDALVLFMYLISRANDQGFVRRSGFRVVSACTGLTEEEYAAALLELESPDPNSRSKEQEGRRLLAEDDGWLIVNFKHYQEIQKEEDRREANRRNVARFRAKQITVIKPMITSDYTALEEKRGEEKRGEEKDKDTVTRRFRPPTLEEVRAYCQERKNNVFPDQWLDHYSSNGWRVGKNPMRDWKAAVRTWERMRLDGKAPPEQAPLKNDWALQKARRDREEWERENGGKDES